MREIPEWLQNVGLDRYSQLFAENAIDFEVLPHLSDKDLRDLGIPLGHRNKLLRAIGALRLEPATDVPPPLSTIGSSSAPAQLPWHPEAERRQLTTIFCDLIGSTELSGCLDAEDYREVIQAYSACCAAVITRFDGFVAKYMGDGVLAYFGYPQAQEDAAGQAVRAGLTLIEEVGRLKPPVGKASLQVRIGIATGVVVVGDLIGAGSAQEQVVAGETPNMAARLQALAQSNTVVISEATRRLVGNEFEYEDLGPRTVKGFSAPILAWRVLGTRAVESRFESRVGRLTPMVGREQEIALLIHRWALAKEGEGQAVLLSGEPGIGKSRISRMASERIETEPNTRLRHQCSPSYTHSAFHPIIAQLERAAGFQRDDPEETRLDKLEALLAQGTDQVAEAASLIAPLLSIPTVGRYPALTYTQQKQKEKTIEALVDQVIGLSQHQPVLCLFEDVHWIDPTTLEVLDQIVDRIESARVLLLVTFRPEFTPSWLGRRHVTFISLNRLGRRQSAALVERIVDGKRLPDLVLDQIVAKTDGVPLFVEELTKTVLEGGLLRETTDRYELTGPLPPFAIPATLQGSLMARLDRLATVKEIAQTGAAIGREFGYELMAAVSPLRGPELSEALDQLVSSELVFMRGVPPEAVYTFKHALVQDTAYDSLLRQRRQQLHKRIAEVLSERWPETKESQPELLAHHYTAAGLIEEAVVYWQRAGERAGRRSANVEAISHFRKGLEVLNTLPASRERSRQELALQIALGAPLMAAKGYTAAEMREAYTRARTLCEEVGDETDLFRVLWGLWVFYLVGQDLRTALLLARQVLEMAKRRDDRGSLVEAHRNLGTTLFWCGELNEALVHLDQAMQLYDPQEMRVHAYLYGQDPGVTARLYGAWALWLLGYVDQARRRTQEGIELARRIAHPFSLAFANTFAAWIYGCAQYPAAIEQHAREALALSIENDFKSLQGWARISLGRAFAEAGQLSDGIDQINQGLDASEIIGAKLNRTYSLAVLAEVRRREGRDEQALKILAEAQDNADATGERYWVSELHRLRGELLAAGAVLARPDAEGCFQDALALARSQGVKLLELRAATSLASFLHGQDRTAEALALLQPVYGWFTEGLDSGDVKKAEKLLATLADC